MPHRQMQMLWKVRRRIIRYDVKRTPISGFEIAQKMGIIVIPYSGLSRKARREAKKVSPDGFYLEPGDGREYIYYDDTIGNGGLQALYDKSNGFYRRQLILTTKEKPADRVDDPFLVEKLRSEVKGIFLWALEGLHHLIANHYQFTVSERTANNLKEAMEQGNNVTSFLKSEVYFSVLAGSRCKSTDFYQAYVRWCQDNLEKPLAASTFIHQMKEQQKSLGIIFDDKCIGACRRFHNVDLNPFVPLSGKTPWD